MEIKSWIKLTLCNGIDRIRWIFEENLKIKFIKENIEILIDNE